MKKQKIKSLAKFAFIIAVLFALLIYLAKGVWDFLKNSEYFKIKEIVVINKAVDFPSLKGRNIFSLDLKELSRQIEKICPGEKLVRVSKVMPDRLIIEFQKRIPFATLKLDKYYFVDSQGVLFDVEKETTIYFPVIDGLKIINPKVGTRYNAKELDFAFGLIKEAMRVGLWNKYPIKYIDVSNPEYLSFSILDDLKIKIGLEDIKGKLNILASLISQVNLDLSKAEYIDLRFQEPTIKLKALNEK
ncbi:MAG: cell division protein FtsQ/DivIB [Candidatus Omnitrophica bacterium]|nr:cell division protein FtsQ/DivIB [Candidatus Omnitrophota bacterium]